MKIVSYRHDGQDSFGVVTDGGPGDGRAVDGRALDPALTSVLDAPNDQIVGPARQQGFLDGLKSGGVQYEIVASATATYTQEQAVPATESMLAAHPDINLLLGLNDSMALGALKVLRDQGNTKTLVAAAADGQKEALAEITKGGCAGQYVSTGLNSPTWPPKAASTSPSR